MSWKRRMSVFGKNFVCSEGGRKRRFRIIDAVL